jgi:putative addiction module component (TIGR02574 family)
MTPRAEDLLHEALALSDGDRADLAAELLASLDDPADEPAEVEAAWAAEIARRAGRVLSGESAGEAWSDVRQRIGARLQQQ